MPSKGRIVYSTDPSPAGPKKPRKETPPAQQTVYVERSRKGRRGKTVTVISNLQHSPEYLRQLLKQFKGLCGAGGTVKEGALEIQGDHRETLITKLEEMGYQAKPKGG